MRHTIIIQNYSLSNVMVILFNKHHIGSAMYLGGFRCITPPNNIDF